MDPTTTDVAQPDAGQGGDTGGTPWSAYLERIPEEARAQVEPVFKDWDANVTRRFQDLSAESKRWEPFEQAGLGGYDPQALAQLVQFAQMAEDPAAYNEWLRGQAEAAGLLRSQPEAEDAYIDPAIEQLIKQQLGPVQQQMQQFTAWQQQQDFAAAQRTQAEQISTQLAELRRQHGEYPQDFVEKLTANYIATDPRNAVSRAFADYQQLAGEIEKGVFASKLAQPATPEVTGAADAVPSQVTTLKEAAALATERLRQQNRS